MSKIAIFKDNKYTKIYFKLIEKCRQRCLDRTHVYYERHHIIPKSIGGDDSKSNLVNLLPKEHFLAHVLLTKMVIDRDSYVKMNWALHKMSYSNRCDYFNGRKYEYYRKKHVKFLKENHPSKNKEWRDKVSKAVKSHWVNNDERKDALKRTFEDWRMANPEKLIENNKKSGKKGAENARLALATRIEYKGNIYIGWNELKKMTGVSKLLYRKYYLNGIDPEQRIGANGPVPKKLILDERRVGDEQNCNYN